MPILKSAAAVILVFLPSIGFVEPPIVCDKPGGMIVADAVFEVRGEDCDSDGSCAYWLRIPSTSNGLDIKGFTLVLLDDEGVDELAVELRHKMLPGGIAEVIFYAGEKYASSLRVSAGYGLIGNCPVFASYRPAPVPE